MKTFFVFTTVGLFILSALVYSCQNDDNTGLAPRDQAILQDMKESFENARTFNDTLENLDKDSFPVEYAGCDSAFHYYTDRFNSLHAQYPHNHRHDNHYHNGIGMQMMNSMMSNHQIWADGHHDEEHKMMDDLESGHNSMFH